jgi:putative Mg2+ transporter-C (MgtC) family protein
VLPTTLAIDDIVLRLATATVCGAVLGLNREFHGKPAGVRTQGLVALGAALATLASFVVAGAADQSAVTRTIQGIVAGIGFLGAGVIVRGENTDKVHGLTTAAVTWVSACLGIACGAGLWAIAAVTVGLALVLLIVGGPFERWAHGRFEPSPPTPPPPPDSSR